MCFRSLQSDIAERKKAELNWTNLFRFLNGKLYMCPVYIRLREKPLMINLDFYVVTASEKCNFSSPPSPFKYPIWIGEGRSKRKSIYLYIATWMAFFVYTQFHFILINSSYWLRRWERTGVKNENDSMSVTWEDRIIDRLQNQYEMTMISTHQVIADESLVISYNRPIGISISVGFVICWQNSKFHRNAHFTMMSMTVSAFIFMTLFF